MLFFLSPLSLVYPEKVDFVSFVSPAVLHSPSLHTVFVAFGALSASCVLRVITGEVRSDSRTLRLLEFLIQARNLNHLPCVNTG